MNNLINNQEIDEKFKFVRYISGISIYCTYVGKYF